MLSSMSNSLIFLASGWILEIHRQANRQQLRGILDHIVGQGDTLGDWVIQAGREAKRMQDVRFARLIHQILGEGAPPISANWVEGNRPETQLSGRACC